MVKVSDQVQGALEEVTISERMSRQVGSLEITKDDIRSQFLFADGNYGTLENSGKLMVMKYQRYCV